MRMFKQRSASYLNGAITRINEIVKTAERKLSSVEFDGFVGTGLSGTMVAPVLAFAMGKRFAIVRKADDVGHHSSGTVESGLNPEDRWVFVDDFLSSGKTRQRVIDAMEDHQSVEYIGDYLYNGRCAFTPIKRRKALHTKHHARTQLCGPVSCPVMPCHD